VFVHPHGRGFESHRQQRKGLQGGGEGRSREDIVARDLTPCPIAISIGQVFGLIEDDRIGPEPGGGLEQEDEKEGQEKPRPGDEAFHHGDIISRGIALGSSVYRRSLKEDPWCLMETADWGSIRK
jgi:hypothetical protein